jgi:hypothetical protein
MRAALHCEREPLLSISFFSSVLGTFKPDAQPKDLVASETISVMMLCVRRNMENSTYLGKVDRSRLRSIQSLKRVVVATLLTCCVTAGSLLASSITIGTDNGQNGFPFGGPYFGNTGNDYQEAYASSDFSGPISITGIDFFLAPGITGDLYSGTYTLSLSIISANIGSLSSTDLSGNLGADNTVFETATLSGSAPNMLTFTGTPFLYDPSMGNLLLDISVAGGSDGKGVAFEDNDGVGTEVARYQNFGAGNGEGMGLVTEFDFAQTAIPEPGMLSLLGCGLAALFVGHLRRR